MNKITLKNIAQDELELLIKQETSVFSKMTESKLKAAAGSGIANGFTVGYSALGFFPDALAWKPW